MQRQLAALLEAYRRTHFRVLPVSRTGERHEPFEVRVGPEDSGLTKILVRDQISCFTLLSAYNPGLERPPEETNEREQKRLRSELAGYRFWEAEGLGEDGFREPTFFVWDMTPGEGRKMAGRFRQLAIVVGAPHLEVELLVLDVSPGKV